MTFTQQINRKINTLIQILQKHVDRKSYTVLIGLLAFVDYFIFIIPMDGILISSVMLRTKKWLSFAISSTMGSTTGALLLFYFVKKFGLDWLIEFYPNLYEGSMWSWSLNFFNKYGILLVFFVAATPLVQQPVVILAALANTPFINIIVAILSGRLIKYLLISYISSHSPHLLAKLWGVKEELNEVGIHINNNIKKSE